MISNRRFSSPDKTQSACRQVLPRRLLQRMTSGMALVFAVLVVQLFHAQSLRAESKDRPNIVLIMADDLGFSDLGCYGGEIETPNLDALARDGMQMTQFYNCAKCTTTRAALVTGRYPRPQRGLLEREDLTIAELMRQAGYATSLSGKWHLGHSESTHPYQRGFDRFYGLLDGCCNYFDPSIPDPKFKGGRTRVFGQDDRRITEFPSDFYTTTAFTDHAIESIEQFSAQEKPFFVHLTYTSPHYPLHAPEKTIQKYLGRYRGGWLELRRERWQRQQAMKLFPVQYRLSPVDSRAYDWDSANQVWEDRRMATYAAMVDEMDHQIGRLVQTLRALGQIENTLIIFLADNGGCAEEPGGRNPDWLPGVKEYYTAVGPAWGWAQNTPFKRYKQWVNEGGISTPMILHWPDKISAGTKSHAVGHVIDLAPTCADIAQTDWPTRYDNHDVHPAEGLSLLPVIQGDAADRHETLYWEWSGNRAIRRGTQKLVYDKLEKGWALYDVGVDRTETINLAEQQPALAMTLQKDWFRWATETGVWKPAKSVKPASP